MVRMTIHIPKIWSCITCINSFIEYHKNYLEILTVTTVCPIPKSDHRIERYYMIKFHGLHEFCLSGTNHA